MRYDNKGQESVTYTLKNSELNKDYQKVSITIGSIFDGTYFVPVEQINTKKIPLILKLAGRKTIEDDSEIFSYQPILEQVEDYATKLVVRAYLVRKGKIKPLQIVDVKGSLPEKLNKNDKQLGLEDKI